MNKERREFILLHLVKELSILTERGLIDQNVKIMDAGEVELLTTTQEPPTPHELHSAQQFLLKANMTGDEYKVICSLLDDLRTS